MPVAPVAPSLSLSAARLSARSYHKASSPSLDTSLIDSTTSPVEYPPKRSCQSLHTESTRRPPTCGHRPVPSRAASSGHGLPKCGWPASLQSPATPEEVDGIRRLGWQQESVRHERDNDNCELKVIHLKLKFRVGARCVQRRASSLSGPRSSWGLCRGS